MSTPASRLSTPASRMSTPASRLSTPASRMSTPTFRMVAPASRMSTPGQPAVVAKNNCCELCSQVYNPRVGRLVNSPWLRAHVNCLRFVKEHCVSLERYAGLLATSATVSCHTCAQNRATVKCRLESCSKVFHLSCVVLSGGQIDYDRLEVWCGQHAGQETDTPEPGRGACTKCTWRTILDDSIRLQCCARSIHITCAQIEAAQNKASCTSCGNKKKYQESLGPRGVYISGTEPETLFIQTLETVKRKPTAPIYRRSFTPTSTASGPRNHKLASTRSAGPSPGPVSSGPGSRGPRVDSRTKSKRTGPVPLVILDSDTESDAGSVLCSREPELIELESDESPTKRATKNKTRGAKKTKQQPTIKGDDNPVGAGTKKKGIKRTSSERETVSSKVQGHSTHQVVGKSRSQKPRRTGRTSKPAESPTAENYFQESSSKTDEGTEEPLPGSPLVQTVESPGSSAGGKLSSGRKRKLERWVFKKVFAGKGRYRRSDYSSESCSDLDQSFSDRLGSARSEEEDLSEVSNVGTDSGYTTKSGSTSPPAGNPEPEGESLRRDLLRFYSMKTRSEGCQEVTGKERCTPPTAPCTPPPGSPTAMPGVAAKYPCRDLLNLQEVWDAGEETARKSVKHRRSSDEENIAPKRMKIHPGRSDVSGTSEAESMKETKAGRKPKDKPSSKVPRTKESRDSVKVKSGDKKSECLVSCVEKLQIAPSHVECNKVAPAKITKKCIRSKPVDVASPQRRSKINNGQLAAEPVPSGSNQERDESDLSLDSVAVASQTQDTETEDEGLNGRRSRRNPRRGLVGSFGKDIIVKDVFCPENPFNSKKYNQPPNISETMKSTTETHLTKEDIDGTRRARETSGSSRAGETRGASRVKDTNGSSGAGETNGSIRAEDTNGSTSVKETSGSSRVETCAPGSNRSKQKKASLSSSTGSVKRKRAEKKIKALNTRQILHGRNWVCWAQETEEFLPTSYQGVPEMMERNISEFVDVNLGEKRFLNIWNDFLKETPYLGFGHLPDTITQFLAARGELIISLGLNRNFLLHLSNMEQVGAIDSSSLFRLICTFQRMASSTAVSKSNASSSAVSKSNASSMIDDDKVSVVAEREDGQVPMDAGVILEKSSRPIQTGYNSPKTGKEPLNLERGDSGDKPSELSNLRDLCDCKTVADNNLENNPAVSLEAGAQVKKMEEEDEDYLCLLLSDDEN